MSTVVVVTAAMMSERGMIRDVRRRDILMGCMGSWIGSTSEDSNGGILNMMCMCVIRLRVVVVVVVGRGEGCLVGVFGGGKSFYGCVKVGGTKNGSRDFGPDCQGGSEGKGIRAIKRAENKNKKIR